MLQTKRATKNGKSRESGKYINDRKYRRGIQKWIIQRNWPHRRHKTTKNKQKHNICVGHHYTPANTNNVNKTCALLQPTGDKNKQSIVFMQRA